MMTELKWERRLSTGIPIQIKTLRSELGLTQGELAQRCGLSSASTISHFESGLRIPSIAMLATIFNALDVTLTIGFERREPKK